jgi:hypothetical protein
MMFLPPLFPKPKSRLTKKKRKREESGLQEGVFLVHIIIGHSFLKLEKTVIMEYPFLISTRCKTPKVAKMPQLTRPATPLAVPV